MGDPFSEREKACRGGDLWADREFYFEHVEFEVLIKHSCGNVTQAEFRLFQITMGHNETENIIVLPILRWNFSATVFFFFYKKLVYKRKKKGYMQIENRFVDTTEEGEGGTN